MALQSKRNSYEEIIHRLDSALDQGFNLEASWITYALFEDRTTSALAKSGGVLVSKNNSFISIEVKLKELKSRSLTHAGLQRAGLINALLDEIIDWKNKRNALMHTLAEVPRPWEDINNDAQNLAIEGREIIARYSSAIMRLSK